MPRKFKFCLRCRRTIAENEIERGLFVQTANGMLCATCAQQLDEETEAAKQLAAAPSTVLRAALSEAERAAQEPAHAEPPEPAVEEKPAPVPPPEPPREKPAADSLSIPHSALRTPHSDPPDQALDGIREHLEAIHRTLIFEKSSPWNVFATVAQCLAVGMLILSAVNWAGDPTRLLLVALVFQVMALTFYVRGK
jgi:hypothetical protein